MLNFLQQHAGPIMAVLIFAALLWAFRATWADAKANLAALYDEAHDSGQ